MSDRTGDYISALFAPEDQLLASLREEADRTGLPPIAVSADEGRLLQVLLTSIRARRVLEVGTLGGYSAIWMARALPDDGELITIEIDPKHAQVAAANVERAGLSRIVRVAVGDARQILPGIARKGGAFDMVFIDADKA